MTRTRAGLVALLLSASMAATGCAGNEPDHPRASGSAGAGAYTPLTVEDFATALQSATKAHTSARVRMSIGSLLHATARVDYSSASPTAAMRTVLAYSGQKVSMRARLIGDSLYVSISGLTPDGKYVRVDKDDSALSGMTNSLRGSDPAELTSAFSRGVSKVEYVGTTQIAGVTTHHYTVTVDTDAALDALGFDELGKPGAAGGKMPESITEQVYLNDDNTLRRGIFAARGQHARVDITGWGEPVSVSPPPADKVVTLPSGSASAEPTD